MAPFARRKQNRQASLRKQTSFDVKITLDASPVSRRGGRRAGDSGASPAKFRRVIPKRPDDAIVVDDDDVVEEEDEKRGREGRQRRGKCQNCEEQVSCVGGSAYVTRFLRSSSSTAGIVMELHGSDSEGTPEGMGTSRAGSNEDKFDGSWVTSNPGNEGWKVEDDADVDVLESDDCDEEKCDGSQVSLKPGAEDLKVGEDGDVEVLEVDDSSEESGAESSGQNVRFEVKEEKEVLEDTDEEGELSASAAIEMELFTSVVDGEGKEEDDPNGGAEKHSACLVKDDEYTGKMRDKESEKKSQTPYNFCCVERRRRRSSRLGNLPRVSCTMYFKTLVSEEEEEKGKEEEEEMESSEGDEALDDNDKASSENIKLREEGGTSSCKEQKMCSVPPRKNLSGTCAKEGVTSGCKEKKRCSVPPPKKKKLSETFDSHLSISSEEIDTGCSLSRESTGILKQTSHFFSKRSEYKKKLGTLSSLLHLADENSNFNLDTKGTESVEHETNVSDREGIMKEGHFKLDTKGKSVGYNVSDRERIMNEGVHVRKSRKKKQGRPSKTNSVFKLLADTTRNNTKKIPADLFPPRNEPCYVEPDIFSWDEDPKVVEKSDYGKAIDELWADFDFALAITNMGTYNHSKHEEEIKKEKLTTCCSEGKHCFVLDEQMGIKCKLCCFVNMDIRYIPPSLVTHTKEKSDWRTMNNKSGQLDFKNLCGEFKSSNGQSSDSTPVTGTVWGLIPGVYETMYQHQREAFEFMWRNLAGGIHLDEVKKSGSRSDVVGGCVISHAPGTGKTRLSIVFIQTYMALFPGCKPVILAPSGMLLTWAEEARKWSVNLPIHNLNSTEYSGMEDKTTLSVAAKECQSIGLTRLVKLCSWSKGDSILGVSYNLFKKLTSEGRIGRILLQEPGLLVLDEGHIPRNERSLIWKVLGKVKTEKRIILSGTPFQNNFVELYNILWLVRPTFAKEISTNTSRSSKKQDIFLDKEHEDLPERSDGKGIWTALTSQVHDGNVEEVRSILKPFVHIHNGSILKDLPGLRECLIILDPLPQQKSVIDKVKHIGANSRFESEYKCCLASVHPSLITHLNMTDEEASLVDKNLLEKLKLNPLEGAKTRFVIEVVRLCDPLNEKVLIFSQYIVPLEMIKELLINEFKWKDGKEVLQLHGRIHTKTRQSSINIFNDANSEAKVLLASTKACCEGIHLTGASRVILLDVVWNPAVGRQAISRAYRIGQKKFVYTYNLITSGTGEREKYNKQIEKDHFSKLLFSQEIDFANAKNNFSQSEEGQLQIISEDKILEQITERLKDMFAAIYYPPKEYCICT